MNKTQHDLFSGDAVHFVTSPVEQPVQIEESDNPDGRKLATISTIKSITPIEGADKIVLAKFTTNNWQCIVSKDIAIGTKCVFFEIDSCLPRIELYSGLKGRCEKVSEDIEIYLIRSLKLKNTLSQGYCVPLISFDAFNFPEIEDGTDVTAILDVKLYQPPNEHGKYGFNLGQSAGRFPTHLCSKTDQERIQSMSTKQIMDMFQYTFEVTEKLDGTSCTMGYHLPKSQGESEFFVCSRNLKVKPNGNTPATYTDAEGNTVHKEIYSSSVFWDMCEKYNVQEKLIAWCKDNNRSIALQGEICGVGIQKNPLKFTDKQWFIFDIYDIHEQRYLSSAERLRICKELELQHVPVISTVTKILPSINVIQTAANSLSDCDTWSTFLNEIIAQQVNIFITWADEKGTNGLNREGLVFKAIENPAVSFKVISNKYLLKHGE